PANSNLICETDFKNTYVFDPSNIVFKMKIEDNNGPQFFPYNTRSLPIDFDFCDPMKLRFKADKIDKTKNYKRVSMLLNDAHCGNVNMEGADKTNPKYEMEYRPEGGAEYIKLEELDCGKDKDSAVDKFVNQFKITIPGEKPVFMDRNTEIEVRCVTDAKYFCEYTPKQIVGRMGLERSKSENGNTTLACPREHNYFVRKGKPDANPKFECLNMRGKLQWMYNGTFPLPEQGPEIYCTDEIDCPKIPNANLHGSFLNNENLPTCHDGGQLRIRKGSGDLKEFYCDRKNGKMFYIKNTGDRVEWQSDEHVYCHYVDNAAAKTSEDIMQIVMIAVLSAVAA
ncbi:hypothetical protein PMAYCL1PPCAC_03024, partial [Pristionchus mayeri]